MGDNVNSASGNAPGLPPAAPTSTLRQHYSGISNRKLASRTNVLVRAHDDTSSRSVPLPPSGLGCLRNTSLEERILCKNMDDSQDNKHAESMMSIPYHVYRTVTLNAEHRMIQALRNEYWTSCKDKLPRETLDKNG
uniref:Uncharacterized protein n=1 Tax=Sphaerodactylus townsendi TaxID=933632 RepID=A0ACB8EQH2_9SAUR